MPVNCCNHNCDQGRTCPQRAVKRRGCDELGVCHGLCVASGETQEWSEQHVPCSKLPQRKQHPFAPGAIEGPHARPAPKMTRWDWALLVLLLVVGECIAWIGYHQGWAQ